MHIDLCKKRKTVESSILEVGNKERKEGGDGVGKGLWKPTASERKRGRGLHEELCVLECLLCLFLYSGHQPTAQASAADEDPAAGRTQGEAAEEEAPSGSSQRSSGTSKAWSP